MLHPRRRMGFRFHTRRVRSKILHGGVAGLPDGGCRGHLATVPGWLPLDRSLGLKAKYENEYLTPPLPMNLDLEHFHQSCSDGQKVLMDSCLSRPPASQPSACKDRDEGERKTNISLSFYLGTPWIPPKKLFLPNEPKVIQYLPRKLKKQLPTKGHQKPLKPLKTHSNEAKTTPIPPQTSRSATH
jgi:hypothetical protein